MTDKKKWRGSMTIEEWMVEREKDPEWLATQERNKIKERKRLAWAAALGENEVLLVAELRRVLGRDDLDSVWDLFNRKEPWRKDVPIPAYTEAFPTLIRNLPRPYHFVIREGIARALTDKYAKDAYGPLLAELQRSRDSGDEEKRRAFEFVYPLVKDHYSEGELCHTHDVDWEQYRFALANAVGYFLQKEDVPEIVEMLLDPAYGDECRAGLFFSLRTKVRRWRWKREEHPEVFEALDAVQQELGLE